MTVVFIHCSVIFAEENINIQAENTTPQAVAEIIQSEKTAETTDSVITVYIKNESNEKSQIETTSLSAINKEAEITSNGAITSDAAIKMTSDKKEEKSKGKIKLATWYGGRFHGRKTTSGEVFNQYKMTAAHRKLPFGTKVKVTNPSNGKSVIVKVNDRGPWQYKYEIDLSYAAFQKIRGKNSEEVPVIVEILGKDAVVDEEMIPDTNINTSTGSGIVVQSTTQGIINVVTDSAVSFTSETGIKESMKLN